MPGDYEAPQTYDDFRTGLTFQAVRELLDVEARAKFEATGERMFITRSTVLGRWHQIKRESWRHYRRYLNPQGR